MKRLIALLLALGILVFAAPMRADKEDKKDEKKADEKKDSKKDDKKDDKGDKDKPKVEEKLTKAQKEELDKLSGTFTVVEFERDGKKSTAEDLKTMKVVQNGAEWIFHLLDEKTEGKDTVYPDKTPKQIDSLYTTGPAREKTVLGIYEITADGVKYCWAEPSKERPKDFSTKPDSGLTLMVLKRIKVETPSDSLKDKDKPKVGGKDKDKKAKDAGKDKDKKDKDAAKDKDKDAAKDKDKDAAKDKDKKDK